MVLRFFADTVGFLEKQRRWLLLVSLFSSKLQIVDEKFFWGSSLFSVGKRKTYRWAVKKLG
jgi:hypothetical protein